MEPVLIALRVEDYELAPDVCEVHVMQRVVSDATVLMDGEVAKKDALKPYSTGSGTASPVVLPYPIISTPGPYFQINDYSKLMHCEVLAKLRTRSRGCSRASSRRCARRRRADRDGAQGLVALLAMLGVTVKSRLEGLFKAPEWQQQVRRLVRGAAAATLGLMAKSCRLRLNALGAGERSAGASGRRVWPEDPDATGRTETEKKSIGVRTRSGDQGPAHAQDYDERAAQDAAALRRQRQQLDRAAYRPDRRHERAFTHRPRVEQGGGAAAVADLRGATARSRRISRGRPATSMSTPPTWKRTPQGADTGNTIDRTGLDAVTLTQRRVCRHPVPEKGWPGPRVEFEPTRMSGIDRLDRRESRDLQDCRDALYSTLAARGRAWRVDALLDAGGRHEQWRSLATSMSELANWARNDDGGAATARGERARRLAPRPPVRQRTAGSATGRSTRQAAEDINRVRSEYADGARRCRPCREG